MLCPQVNTIKGCDLRLRVEQHLDEVVDKDYRCGIGIGADRGGIRIAPGIGVHPGYNGSTRINNLAGAVKVVFLANTCRQIDVRSKDVCRA